MMTNLQMDVIPEPKAGSASVLALAKTGEFAIMRGVGETNYLCGTCQNVICEGMERGQIIEIVFKCPSCGSFNRAKGT